MCKSQTEILQRVTLFLGIVISQGIFVLMTYLTEVTVLVYSCRFKVLDKTAPVFIIHVRYCATWSFDDADAIMALPKRLYNLRRISSVTYKHDTDLENAICTVNKKALTFIATYSTELVLDVAAWVSDKHPSSIHINRYGAWSIALVAAMQYPDKFKEQCLISWDQFTSTVAGRFWHTLYKIDFRINISEFGRSRNLYTVLGNNTVYQRSSHWGTENGDMVCETHQANITKVAGQDNAILEFITPFFSKTDFFISNDTTKYVMNSACFGPLDEDGLCPEPIVIIMILDQRTDTDNDGIPDGDIILNEIPWSDIEHTTKKCFGKSFIEAQEPKIEWIWYGPDCPFPTS